MSLNDILAELKSLRQENFELRQEIQEVRTILRNDNRRNDMGKGIFKLPYEILGQILDHVNQMDIINLSYVQRSFRDVCRAKLMERIYVCNDDTEFAIPKDWYDGRYSRWTIVCASKFIEMAKTNKNLHLIKRVEFYKVDLVSVDFLNEFTKKSFECVVTSTFDPEFLWQIWMSKHQKEKLSSSVVLYNDPIHELDDKQLEVAKYLELNGSTRDKIEQYLSAAGEFNNIGAVTLSKPPAFKLTTKIRVPVLDLCNRNDTLARDILKNFDLRTIKKLRVTYYQDLLFETLDSNTGSFESLEHLDVPLSVHEFDTVVKHLPRDSLRFVRVPNILSSGDQAENEKSKIVTALKHHTNSLQVILEGYDCPLQKKGTSKSYINPLEFPELVAVRINDVVMRVERFGDLARLVSVQYH
ncbi:hypothetical protein Cantr_07167 [Candida viswanathii]|uniref:F-box domain-containing protein n=1 Tax=Candida viswanathii TaxID=5486 RepID=A0A367Y1Y0_9ASCO|nr:hypothetical protein Cantr_07167 [Candida viswanathii]